MGARDATDDHAGRFFADPPESRGLTLAVVELARGAAGRFEARTRTVAIAESVVGEDPRVVAVVLAHELQHALDKKRMPFSLLDVDCLALEVRGFEAQARVVQDYEGDGTAGVAGDARDRAACAW